MVKIDVIFVWNSKEVLHETIELEGPIVGAESLVDFFQKYWKIDVSDYTLRDFSIVSTDIRINLKSLEDFRQIQLSRIG